MGSWVIGHARVPLTDKSWHDEFAYSTWTDGIGAWRDMVRDYASTADADNAEDDADATSMEADIGAFLVDGRPPVPGEPFEASFEQHDYSRELFWLRWDDKRDS